MADTTIKVTVPYFLPFLPPGTSQVSASPSYYTAAQQTAQAQAQAQAQVQAQAQAQAQQAAAAAYYGYGSYRPQTPSYTPYYSPQSQAQKPVQSTPPQQQRSQGQQLQQPSSMSVGSSGHIGAVRGTSSGMASSQMTATQMKTTTASAPGGGGMVTYPAYTPTNYYSAYNKQTVSILISSM